MRTIAAKCRFCGKNLTLEIAPDYDEERSPVKLIKLAACNRCADLRQERRHLEDTIRTICSRTTQLGQTKITDSNSQKAVKTVCEAYTKLVARWYGFDGSAWDDAFPDAIISAPDQWQRAVSNYWKVFRQANPPELAL